MHTKSIQKYTKVYKSIQKYTKVYKLISSNQLDPDRADPALSQPCQYSITGSGPADEFERRVNECRAHIPWNRYVCCVAQLAGEEEGLALQPIQRGRPMATEMTPLQKLWSDASTAELAGKY